MCVVLLGAGLGQVMGERVRGCGGWQTASGRNPRNTGAYKLEQLAPKNYCKSAQLEKSAVWGREGEREGPRASHFASGRLAERPSSVRRAGEAFWTTRRLSPGFWGLF